jgi:hypothetical protein
VRDGRERLRHADPIHSLCAPIQELRFRAPNQEIGVVRDFFHRPDIAARCGRADMAKCGWRAMIYLPKLSHGEYDLVPHGIDSVGNSAELPAIRVRIVD